LELRSVEPAALDRQLLRDCLTLCDPDLVALHDLERWELAIRTSTRLLALLDELEAANEFRCANAATGGAVDDEVAALPRRIDWDDVQAHPEKYTGITYDEHGPRRRTPAEQAALDRSYAEWAADEAKPSRRLGRLAPLIAAFRRLPRNGRSVRRSQRRALSRSGSGTPDRESDPPPPRRRHPGAGAAA